MWAGLSRIGGIGTFRSEKLLIIKDMKRTSKLLTFSVMAIFGIGMMIASCTGPEGQPGADGTDGTDGVDANSFCIQCHTLDNKTTVKTQFAMSSHGIGNYVGYAGGRKACAKCHSYNGAMETMLTGKDTTAADIALPVAFQCDMCHDFHMTLEEGNFPDYALGSTDPVSLISTGHTETIDLAGSANACAECHQTRTPIAAYNSPNLVKITSTHWGGHHGPQGNILAGVGAFEPVGSMTIENSAHTAAVGCSDCHMAKNATRTDVGGHTWAMKAADGYENMTGCLDCHSNATSFDINGVQTEIAVLLEELHGLLVQHGLYSEEGLHEGGHPVVGEYPANKAGAVYNYILFEEDRSVGVHNPTYTKAVLTNTVEMVQTW